MHGYQVLWHLDVERVRVRACLCAATTRVVPISAWWLPGERVWR